MRSAVKAAVLFLFIGQMVFPQKVQRVDIGVTSEPANTEVTLELIARWQSYNSSPNSPDDYYDQAINSPKSALILENKNKIYINSLEGFTTPVYDLTTFERIDVIEHKFDETDAHLFTDTTLFDYEFRTRSSRYNIFKGKPVEGTFSHDGKFLWVTYYRRSYDRNAIDPSAVAIIDTDKDSIVRVMPTAPLPKMIAGSSDNKYMAVTHWGDNTVGIIDISSGDPAKFKYIEHFVVERRLDLNIAGNKKINRDSYCGFCLRGTAFTPDNKSLLVGRMGGGGIALFDMDEMKYIGTVFGMKNNLRHIIIRGDNLYLSSNRTGFIQKTSLSKFIEFAKSNQNSDADYNDWESCYIGSGARTISLSPDGKYIFAAVNNESKVCVIKAENMQRICCIKADSFPVGLDVNENLLIVTSQGKSVGGGFSVMIYKVNY